MIRMTKGLVAILATSATVAVVVGGWGVLSAWAFGGLGSADRDHGNAISFSEDGLPFGTAWSMTLGDSTEVGVAPALITFSEPDSSYPYSVGGVAGYRSSPAAGEVVVDGTPLVVRIDFASAAQPIQHVVVIVLEDEEVGTVLSGSGYLDYLATTYGSASQFYAVCHGSLPDYSGMTSGRYVACGSESIPQSPVENLPDLLEQAGDSWAGYFEGMQSPCQTYSSAGYVTDHNPFLLYEDIVENPYRCDTHVVNSAEFNESVAAGGLPNVSFYIPDSSDDCRSSSLAVCSSWLQGFLAPILNSTDSAEQAEVAHTAYFVLFDEGTTNFGYAVPGAVNAWCQNETGSPLTACGGHTYLAVVSPFSVGLSYPLPATDYNVESTIEWLFGLGSDGGFDGSPAFPSMSSLFAFSSNP
jgi:Phosphoesterase family